MSLPVNQAYSLWLQGYPLRKIGKLYGVSQTTVHKHLRSKYGRDATNLRVNSMSRSIIKDYPKYKGIQEIALSIKGSGTSYSKHSLDMLTRYQVVHDMEILEYLIPVPEVSEYTWDFLRLPYYMLMVTMLTYILHPENNL